MITLEIFLNTIVFFLEVEAYFHFILTLWVIKNDDSIDKIFLNTVCASLPLTVTTNLLTHYCVNTWYLSNLLLDLLTKGVLSIIAHKGW